VKLLTTDFTYKLLLRTKNMNIYVTKNLYMTFHKIVIGSELACVGMPGGGAGGGGRTLWKG